MNRLRYLAGALLCLLCSASANASCVSREALLGFVAERYPQARLVVLAKSDARVFLAAVNRMARPPLAADEIVIVDVAHTGAAVPVGLFEAGCLTRLGALPRPFVRAMLNLIARHGA